MKKPLLYTLSILAGVIAGVLIWGAVSAATGISLFNRNPASPVVPEEMNNAELTALAYSVLNNIRSGDYTALSLVAHPELGVVFSPCATINLSTNKRFLPDQIVTFGTDTQRYVWGVYTTDSKPIELTIAEYFAEFILDRDYSSASMIGVNRVVRSGNALDNITEIFRGAKFVDFHVPGIEDDDGEEHQWSSLRLGFEEYNGELRLTIILHSQWTA